MHNALAVAAMGGIEDVLRLLTLVGNDVEHLDMGFVLSTMVSKLRIY